MQQFADKIQVSVGNVGDWESEKRTSVPGASTLVAIANTFNVSLDWLLLGKMNHDNDLSRSEVSVSTPLKSLDHYLAATSDEDIRKLMEAAVALPRSDLQMLNMIALHLIEKKQSDVMEQSYKAN